MIEKLKLIINELKCQSQLVPRPQPQRYHARVRIRFSKQIEGGWIAKLEFSELFNSSASFHVESQLAKRQNLPSDL